MRRSKSTTYRSRCAMKRWMMTMALVGVMSGASGLSFGQEPPAKETPAAEQQEVQKQLEARRQLDQQQQQQQRQVREELDRQVQQLQPQQQQQAQREKAEAQYRRALDAEHQILDARKVAADPAHQAFFRAFAPHAGKMEKGT